MTQRIIYQPDGGGVAVINPTPEALAQWGIEAIAAKDVPAGRPYKIVDASYIPTDRTFRNAWEVDASFLTDGVGADSDEFPTPVEAAPEPFVVSVPPPVDHDEVTP